MHTTLQLHTSTRFVAVFALTVAFAACGDGDATTPDEGSAGSSGASTTGGTQSSAGSESTSAGKAGESAGTSGSGSGGKVGTAGTTGSAGTAGSAGTGNTSGSGGGGGASNQAGASGEGGAAGQGGDGSDGGASDGGANGQGDGGAGGQGPEVVVTTGTGNDGNLSVEAEVDLSVANSGARTCADGGDAVSYSVTQLSGSAATLAAAPAAGCLAVGDEVLLINLQGTAANFANVGNYETFRVSAVNGDAVTFSKAKTRFYGDAADDTNLGTLRTNQRVMLQRVPNYQSVSVAAAGSLSATAWDGVKGGVLFFRAAGTVSVAGALGMSGKGYAGGAQNNVVNTTGQQGESLHGLGASAYEASQGAGGGGIGDGNGCVSYGAAAGGGGYATPGGPGSSACSGLGGSAYGDVDLLARLFLGSGGGSGGTDNVLSDNPPGGYGGRGGGIVVIGAANLEVTGTLASVGGAGEGDTETSCNNGASTTVCWDYSGPGGAGSGGSILLDAATASLGTELVDASGGLGGLGYPSGDGGDGGDGRIAVHSATLTGATLPAASQ